MVEAVTSGSKLFATHDMGHRNDWGWDFFENRAKEPLVRSFHCSTYYHFRIKTKLRPNLMHYCFYDSMTQIVFIIREVIMKSCIFNFISSEAMNVLPQY